MDSLIKRKHEVILGIDKNQPNNKYKNVYLTFCNLPISSILSSINMVYIKNQIFTYEGVISSIITLAPNTFIPS